MLLSKFTAKVSATDFRHRNQPAMSDELEIKLREHAWRRGVGYAGKD